MKKYIFPTLMLSAAIFAAASVSCSKEKNYSDKSVSDTTSYTAYENANERPTAATQEGLASNEINVGVAEAADENQTTFKLNSVIDSGEKTEDGRRYFYLDVTIGNSSSESYELNCLNNFYILLPDGSESHFDIRTQIFADSNYSDKYFVNPFTVPANGELNGYIGGFLIPEGVDTMTVCFFPTQNNNTNKSSVIKCEVSADDIISLPADLAG